MLPQFLIQKVWGGILECSVQSSAQVKLTLLVWGSHLENHCSKEIHPQLGIGFFHRSSTAVGAHRCAYKSPRDLVKIQILVQLVWVGPESLHF